MGQIILEGNSEETENSTTPIKIEQPVRPNLFQGRTEREADSSKYPDWDIVPPNQFINPRIKQQ
jgi:hypothetical protein